MKKKLLRTLLFTGFICTSFPIENDFNKCLDEVIKKSDSAEKEMIEIIEKRAQEANSN
jgi:hypothetical protein